MTQVVHEHPPKSLTSTAAPLFVLTEFLLSAFTPAEFHSFIAQWYASERVAEEFCPAQGISPKQFFDHACGVMFRHGIITAQFMERLAATRLNRREEISHLARRIIFSADDEKDGKDGGNKKVVSFQFEGSLNDLTPERVSSLVQTLRDLIGDADTVVLSIRSGSIIVRLETDVHILERLLKEEPEKFNAAVSHAFGHPVTAVLRGDQLLLVADPQEERYEYQVDPTAAPLDISVRSAFETGIGGLTPAIKVSGEREPVPEEKALLEVLIRTIACLASAKKPSAHEEREATAAWIRARRRRLQDEASEPYTFFLPKTEPAEYDFLMFRMQSAASEPSFRVAAELGYVCEGVHAWLVVEAQRHNVDEAMKDLLVALRRESNVNGQVGLVSKALAIEYALSTGSEGPPHSFDPSRSALSNRRMS